MRAPRMPHRNTDVVRSTLTAISCTRAEPPRLVRTQSTSWRPRSPSHPLAALHRSPWQPFRIPITQVPATARMCGDPWAAFHRSVATRSCGSRIAHDSPGCVPAAHGVAKSGPAPEGRFPAARLDHITRLRSPAFVITQDRQPMAHYPTCWIAPRGTRLANGSARNREYP